MKSIDIFVVIAVLNISRKINANDFWNFVFNFVVQIFLIVIGVFFLNFQLGIHSE